MGRRVWINFLLNLGGWTSMFCDRHYGDLASNPQSSPSIDKQDTSAGQIIRGTLESCHGEKQSVESPSSRRAGLSHPARLGLSSCRLEER